LLLTYYQPVVTLLCKRAATFAMQGFSIDG